jgi:hypothetical protein
MAAPVLIMLLGFQETSTPSRTFDPDIVWQVFSQLFARLLAHLPYLILGALVFVLFLVGARLIKRILIVRGPSFAKCSKRRRECYTNLPIGVRRGACAIFS